MATVAAIPVTLSPKGKLVANGGGKELAELMGSLPNGRYWHKHSCWACDVTPAAAHRLLALPAVEPDATVLAMAVAFREGQRRAVNATLRGDLPQPLIRKGDDWDHQLRAYHFAMALDAAMLAAHMGTGKTRVAVNTLLNRRCMRTLILCPVSVRGVWRREFAKHAAEPPEVIVLENGSVAAKTARAMLEMARCQALRRPLVIVVNYEAAKLGAFAAWSLEQDWDCVILDESHRCKAADTAVSKYAAKLGRKARYRLCLTGTPMAHSPLDLFGQFRFLDPGIFGTSWHRFRNQYSVSGPLGAHHIVGYRNQDELAERFALLAYRVEADVLDLPAEQHITLPVALSPPARQAYQQLDRELIADVKAGVCTVSNALTRLLRLQQCTSGYLVLDDTNEVVDLADDKAATLADLLDGISISEPVVVFCRFRHDLDKIREVAESTGRHYGELSGRRKDLTEHAQMPETIDLLGVQISSGGVGIDLTRACYAVYYSPGLSLGDYQQSLARVNRPGQTRPVLYYHIVASDSVDEKVYDALAEKKDVIEAVFARMAEISGQ